MENKIPAEPQAIDTLSLQYPKFGAEIATARGHYSDEEITGYLSGKEQEALMHYQPPEVDTFLGRTPQSKQRIDDFTRQSKIYGYHKATGLMQPDIEERMTTAKKMNLNEAPLMSDDKLYTDIKKLADAPTDDTWTDYVKNKILIPLGVGGKQVLSSTLLAGTAVPLAGLQKQKEQYDAFVFEQMQPIYDQLGVGEDMKQLNAPENSLIRQSVIALLNVDKGFQEDLRAKYTQAAGEDPSLVSKIAHGVGTSIGFMLAASAAVASGQFSPKAAALIGAATEGGLEALSEAGSVLSDAAAEGKYDEGVSAAQNSFLTNLGLNTGLNYLGGRWNPWIAQMKPGIGKKLLQVGAEVGEEAFLQEPLQGVIENAAKQTLEEGGNFYSNLLESVKQYPEILEEVAPSTIGSTLITQMLFMGLSGSGGQKRPATQAQGQAQGRAVDMIAADRAEVEVNLRNLQPTPAAEAQATAPEQEQSVFLPREALETYNQENPGRLEELGVSTEGAGEIMMTPAQYDALVESDLNFAETIRNDVRRGPTAMTNNEVVETLQKKITTAATTTPEYKAVVQDLEEKAIKAGRDKGEARAMARIGAAFAARLSEETGVSMADAVNIEMREMRYEDVERNSLEQSALHGSRANFNAVDLGYTGQGADTNANPDEGGHFGWGFYSTQEREHAEMYRKSVTEGESTGQLYKVDVPESDTVLDWDAPLAEQPAQVRAALESDELTRGIMDRAEASTEEIATLPADYQPPATTTKEVKTHFGDWIEVDITPEAREKLAGTLLPSIAINESKTKPGKYEINLGNGEIMARDSAEELISLAKDRLQQEYAEKLLAVIRENNISENYDGGSGGWLYQELRQELGSARAASEYLAKLGVPGLQYGNAKGSKDFVTWNEQAVDVLETYYQSAYHGTPHRFDKFDLSKIGSGEGAQVFGWGLYFAEDKTVAEGYRRSLSSDQQEKLERKKFSGRTLLGWYKYLEEQASRASTDTMQAYYDRMAIVENLLIHFNVKDAVQYAQDEGYSQEAIQWVEKTFKNLKVPGQLYKVDVPESEVLLDWDKPFSKQPTEVKNALEKLFKENKNPSPERGGDTLLRLDKKTTGEHIYLDIVGALGSPEKASKLLNTYGIPGLRYLDQGSRTSGEGTHNIVVFNDEAVDILETYYQEQEANKAPDNPNAAIEFLPGGKSLISFFENANKSSGFHEFSHHMFRLMVDVHDMEGVSEQFKTDVQTALRETGITLKEFREGSSKLRVAQERFATGFEVYLAEGKAPSKELRSVFRRLRTWLIDVYHNVSQSLGLELSPAMRDVYSRLLASPEQIDAEYEAQTKVKDLAVELAALKEEVAVMERKIRAADPTALPPKELDAYKAKIKAKQAQQKDINRLVKGINKMADSDKIIWSAQKDIQKLVSDYDLKRRSKNTQERRAELEAYLAANPGAEDTMNAADLKYLGTTTLNDMTIEDLRNLSGEVEALYAQGEQQFIQWDAERRQRGDEKGAALRKSLEKRKHTRPKIQMSAEDMGKQYKGLKGKAAKAKDWMFAATLGPDRFFDWLDGGATGYKGAFVKHFVDDFNKAQDGVLRNVFSRRQWLQDELQKLGFSNLRHFSKVVATVEGVDFTRDKIMEIYVGMRNEKKADAILRGTFGEVADPQGAVAYLVGQLTPEEKAAAELVVEDHDRNFDRINGALIQAFNKGMDQEESYTSIHRLEHGSPAGMIDAESFDAITDSAGAAGVLRRVEEGFMKKRVEMGRQTSIKLGLFENWHNDVSRHEHAAGMALIARDISSAMMSKNPADDMTLPKMVKERFGNEAWQTLVDFFNINVTDNARSAHNLLDNAASFLIKNMSVTYLAGNLATAMKQMTSIPRFLITAGPDKILGSILQFSVNPNGFIETVYDLDPQMRNRKGSAILQAIKEDPNWGNSVYQRTLDIAFAPISIMDRWVAAIGWKATYDANFKRLGHSGAVREAQRATRLTQQASSSKDQARMWRQSGFVRATMVFSSDAAQTFGMTAYDLAQQMRTGQMTKAMSTILALAMTAVLMQAASKGLPSDEDDEESGASWLADAFLSQTIEAIPLVGKEIMLLYDRLSGQYRGSQYSAIVAPIEKIARAWKLWSDEDAEEGDDWKASGLAIEALSLTGIAPVPYTGVRRVMQSLSLAGESGTAAALNMVGIRPRKEE